MIRKEDLNKCIGIGLTTGAIAGCALILVFWCHLAELVRVLRTVTLVHLFRLYRVFRPISLLAVIL
jgi:hypothetical protein